MNALQKELMQENLSLSSKLEEAEKEIDILKANQATKLQKQLMEENLNLTEQLDAATQELDSMFQQMREAQMQKNKTGGESSTKGVNKELMQEHLAMSVKLEEAEIEIKSLNDKLLQASLDQQDVSAAPPQQHESESAVLIQQLKLEIEDLQFAMKSKESDQEEMAQIFEQMMKERDDMESELKSFTSMVNENAALSQLFHRMVSLHKEQVEYDRINQEQDRGFIGQGARNSSIGQKYMDLESTVSSMEEELEQKRNPAGVSRQLRPSINRSQSFSPRNSGSRASILLNEANNWLSGTAEAAKLEMQVEQLEGSIAKLEIEVSRTKKQAVDAETALQMVTAEKEKLQQQTTEQAKEIKKLKKLHVNYRKKAVSVSSNSAGKGNSLDELAEEDATELIDEEELVSSVSALVASELSHVADLMALDTDYSSPIAQSSKLAKVSAKAGLLEGNVKSLCYNHQMLHKVLSTSQNDFMQFCNNFKTACETLAPYWLEFVELSGSCLSADAPDKLSKFVTERKSRLLDKYSRDDIARFPLQRVGKYLEWVEGYKELIPCTHTHWAAVNASLAAIQKIHKELEEEEQNYRQQVILAELSEKVYNIPDDWAVAAANRKLLFSGVLYYVFHEPGNPEATIADLPKDTAHPIAKTKLGESVRVFLFSDCILLTTFKYKYRYRFSCFDFAPKPGHNDYVLLFQPDLFTDEDMRDMKDIDQGVACGSSTVLLCSSLKQREEWLAQIRSVSEALKDEVADSKKKDVQVEELKQDMGGYTPPARGSLSLFLRIRPFVQEEEKKTGQVCISVDGRTATLDQSSMESWRHPRTGVYNHIFGPESTQTDVYARVGRDLMHAVSTGCNSSVLAYGNTGAGKTYSLFGTQQRKGLVLRFLDSLFTATVPFHVQMSYVQVYNGKVQDLCCGEPAPELKLKNGVLKGMVSLKVRSASEAVSILLKGNNVRTTRKHSMNELSSRSHAILILEISRGSVRSSCFIVDLAGSENASVTGVAGKGMLEAREINKSLISLARVMNAINENQKRTKGKQVPVPFRESPLTMVLKDVLVGDFISAVLLNVSCSSALQQARLTAKTMAFGDSVMNMAKGAVGSPRKTTSSRSHSRQPSRSP